MKKLILLLKDSDYMQKIGELEALVGKNSIFEADSELGPE